MSAMRKNILQRYYDEIIKHFHTHTLCFLKLQYEILIPYKFVSRTISVVLEKKLNRVIRISTSTGIKLFLRRILSTYSLRSGIAA